MRLAKCYEESEGSESSLTSPGILTEASTRLNGYGGASRQYDRLKKHRSMWHTFWASSSSGS